MVKHCEFGVVSEGTLRTEDLLATFADTLDSALAMQPRRFKRASYRAMIRDARKILRTLESGDITQVEPIVCDASDTLDSLYRALEEFAPAYGYFGASEGDGACIGFFLSDEWVHDARDNDIPVIDDSARHSAELPAGYRGEWFHVSDHGNVTLYVRNSRGKNRYVWGCV